MLGSVDISDISSGARHFLQCIAPLACNHEFLNIPCVYLCENSCNS